MDIIKEGTVTNPAGFEAAAVRCGLKQSGNLDLVLVAGGGDCTAAGVFTQNLFAAAPVVVDKETLGRNKTAVSAIVINAGNANACTGEPGIANARAMQTITAESLGCQPEQVLVLSTGVIGVQLPMEKVSAGIKTAAGQLSRENGLLAAQGMMTTDTYPKHLAVQVELPGGVVTIGGMAKGAGMIHPNMATMLGVLTTDAVVSADALQGMLETAVSASFNCISVDGDTSTNDTVLLLANGKSGVGVETAESHHLFQQALTFVCAELAKMIVRDGEGASKFVEIQVSGTTTQAEAHAIANTIATSPLVKTAFAGSDPNWGRILAAAGRAGVWFDTAQVNLWVGGMGHGLTQINTDLLCLVRVGTPTDYQESVAAAVFALPEFVVKLEVGSGPGTAVVWTTDLTHEYVTINADYRT